jgi:hypothetical protein
MPAELTLDPAELGFDPDVLREKYREERDKRVRADGQRRLNGNFSESFPHAAAAQSGGCGIGNSANGRRSMTTICRRSIGRTSR